MENPETGTAETRVLQLWVIEPQPDGSVRQILIGAVIDGVLYFPDEL